MANKVTLTGELTGLNAGEYTAYATPAKDYCWEDGTTGQRELPWKIIPATMAVPTQSGSLTYNGRAQSPSWKGYDANAMTMGGETSAVNVGWHTATFTLNNNGTWSDGTRDARSARWYIACNDCYSDCGECDCHCDDGDDGRDCHCGQCHCGQCVCGECDNCHCAQCDCQCHCAQCDCQCYSNCGDDGSNCGQCHCGQCDCHCDYCDSDVDQDSDCDNDCDSCGECDCDGE